MFDIDESGEGQLLMRLGHIPQECFAAQCSRIQERHKMYGPRNEGDVPVLLASVPGFLNRFRCCY